MVLEQAHCSTNRLLPPLEWNLTRVEYPQNHQLHHLFEVQAKCTPEEIAVVYEGATLTYRELDQRANQLAQHLHQRGVGPDILVGLYMERCSELVVALLAILKAGGAYVPFDPNYPVERLNFMLHDAQVSILLTQSLFIHDLPSCDAYVFCLDSDWEQVIHQPQEPPDCIVEENNLAYVIYTSGSTGQPKGAMNTHKGICNRLLWAQEMYHLNAADRVLQKTTYCFDISVWEFFWPLIAGARLVLARPGGQADSAYLIELIQQQQITTVHFVPSMLQLFLEEPGVESLTSIRLVICSGEALPLKLQERFFARSKAELYNLYGPTEAAVEVTYWRCKAKNDLTIVPIGRPITNTQIYILNEQLQPVPIGVAGELHIGGVCLARGYLNRPQLTAERFIPNPFGTIPGERLYKTGDLARYLPSGDIEYLGRADYQVKMHGFRIELGEIEATLSRHPSVRETVVVVHEDADDKWLVAYIVPLRDHTITVTDLRPYLLHHLPEYMVPSMFMLLEALPLNSNGKVDRRKLPVPKVIRPETIQGFVAPRNTVEEILAATWANVLHIPQVSVHDNFFVLGGDSIRGIRASVLAREKGIHLSLQELYRYQTISGLAQHVLSVSEQAIDASTTEQYKPFHLLPSQDRAKIPTDVEDAYPLTRLQMGMLYHSELDTQSTLYHIINSEHVHTSFILEPFQIAVQQIVARHPILRTSFDFSTFSEPLQLVHSEAHLPLQIEDIRSLTPEQQDKHIHAWVEAEKHQRFDYMHAPLLRLQVHVRSDNTFQFSLSMHHAILDGWSLATLLTELLHLYLSTTGYIMPALEPAPGSAFGAFVALERQILSEQISRTYWLNMLADYCYSHLPRRSPSLPAEQTGQFAVYNVAFPQAEIQHLKHIAQLAQVPLKSVLLAAHLRVLALLSGQSDVLTGMVTNGRPEANDGERMLGLFLNTVPLRFPLTGGSWLNLIQQTFQAEQALLPHRRYPLAEIQQQLDGHSLFEVTFNYVHFHVAESLHRLDNFSFEEELAYTETNFPFTVEFVQTVPSNELFLYLEYTTALLSEQQVSAIGSYYVQTLSAMVANPYQQYESVSLLSRQEREQALILWSQEQPLPPVNSQSPACLHQLFEAQVACTPEGIAVIAGQDWLSYRQLDERANQLAHYLLQSGIGPEALVGVFLERSPLLIVALLGILKAGGAYVPLETTYPAERLSFMLSDARVSLLLTNRSLLTNQPIFYTQELQILCLDEVESSFIRQSTTSPAQVVHPEQLAYVIYTSGSTGKPKGAMIPHRSIAAFALAAGRAYALGSQDRVLQFTSLSWDTSAEEIYPCLTHGATLVLRPADMLDVPAQFLARCQELQVSVLNLPTAYWHVVCSTLVPQDTPIATSLRLVIIGGEKVHAEHVERWRAAVAPGVHLLNTYGVAEATVEATSIDLSETTSSTQSLQEVPIGTPFCGCRVYVLDSYQQPVPIGVAGEVYLGGPGIARGYLGRPALTSERFVPDPFGKEPGQRLYKTGDLARYRADGVLEYVGRVDEQIKIRGYRIELAEIEAVLSLHPMVREVVVIAREDVVGDKQLVAYLVITGEVVSERVMRQFAQEKLPAYMVPSRMVQLKALPLTINGKVDRQRLPLPKQQPAERSAMYVVPGDPVEVQLVKIWEQVLGVQRIGVQDDFFELGGHSLFAMQIVTRIRDAFAIEISLATFFKAPVIKKLAECVLEQLMQEIDMLNEAEAQHLAME